MTDQSPLHITHFLSRIRLEDGGVVRAVLDICAALARAGHRVTLLTADGADVPDAWEGGEGVPEVVIEPMLASGGRALLPWGSLAPRAAAVLERTDVLHLHVPWEPANVALASAARTRRVPHVISTHGMLDDWAMQISAAKKRVYLALFARKMLTSADIVLGSAEKESIEGAKHVRGATFRHLPLMFDPSPFEALPGPDVAREIWPALRGRAHPVCFLGRVHHGKGLKALVPAMARVVERGLDAALFVAGRPTPDYREALDRLADALGVTDRVHFLGHVSGEQKVSLLQACKALVLPSIHENFGFVVPEALAAGTPAVISPGVAIRGELEATGGVVTVERDPERLAAAIAELLSDEDRRRRMALDGQANIMRWLDPSRVTGEYTTMYRSIM